MEDRAITTTERIKAAADKLDQAQGQPKVFVGFDGFLDTILHVVDSRLDTHRYTRMDSMAAYADRIKAAAGYSANIELVPQQIKLGGNGPIMADGLYHLGCRITYAGCIGAPEVHPVFTDFAAACDRVISMSNPATTDALEFVDGKLLMGQMQNLEEVNWSNLLSQMSAGELMALIDQLDMIAAVNWTMLPAMNEILKGLQEVLGAAKRRPWFFVDLADPRKRTPEDIREVLELLSSMQAEADMILGMNEHESAQVEQVLLGEADMDLRNRALRIRETLKIKYAVIHPLRSAYVAGESGVSHLEGPYAPSPVLTTGAGDTFNAGFCRGLLAGLEPEEAIGCGVCASGFYVRNARPPSLTELASFMRQWASADCCPVYDE